MIEPERKSWQSWFSGLFTRLHRRQKGLVRRCSARLTKSVQLRVADRLRDEPEQDQFVRLVSHSLCNRPWEWCVHDGSVVEHRTGLRLHIGVSPAKHIPTIHGPIPIDDLFVSFSEPFIPLTVEESAVLAPCILLLNKVKVLTALRVDTFEDFI